MAVPTREYHALLTRRGISRDKLRMFRRGIDPAVFAPMPSGDYLSSTFNISDGITLLHCGRVSKEKSLDFLADVYEAVVAECPAVNLLFVGDGPYLDAFRTRMKKNRRVYFAGRMERGSLPALYSSCHFLVFPSVTDTFGMVVLEAQSCGLPALVSDFGGPQEIILSGKTGFVAEAGNRDAWKNAIENILTMIRSYPKLYLEMRAGARPACSGNLQLGFGAGRHLRKSRRRVVVPARTRRVCAVQRHRCRRAVTARPNFVIAWKLARQLFFKSFVFTNDVPYNFFSERY